jgi:hypothetical protein
MTDSSDSFEELERLRAFGQGHVRLAAGRTVALMNLRPGVVGLYFLIAMTFLVRSA